MTSWMEERDRLVAQTQAFVEQVAAAHPNGAAKLVVAKVAIDALPAAAEPAPAEVPVPADVLVAVPAPVPASSITALRPPPVVSERTSIMERVAAFRARQARMNDERESRYATLQTRIRNELKAFGGGNETEGGRL